MNKKSAKKAAYDKEWNARNREHLRAYQKAYRERNRDKARAYAEKWLAKQPPEKIAAIRARQLAKLNAKNAQKREEARGCEDKREFLNLEWAMAKYPGLTLDKYHSLLERQDFGCGICGADIVAVPRKRVHIDHDHTTGKVRGILCAKCNTGLGKLDDGRLFRAAEKYLKRVA